MSPLLKTIKEWIKVQGEEIESAPSESSRQYSIGLLNGLKAVENLIETTSTWRNFRDERPENGQYVWVCAPSEPEPDCAWYSAETETFKSVLIRIRPEYESWCFWQPAYEPAPPTPEQIQEATSERVD